MGNALIIFIYCMAVYGLSNMMVFGSGPFRIFEGIRWAANRISGHFGSMFSCMMCFPANVGWVTSLVDWFLIEEIAFTPFNILLAGTGLWWLALIADCCFASGMTWLIHNIESFFESIAGGTSALHAGNDDDNDDIVEIHNG